MSDRRTRRIYTKDITCRSDWYTLYLLGDTHAGEKNFMERECVNMVDYIAGHPQNGVLLTGDLTENVLPSSVGTMFELAIASPVDQRAKITKILTPIKKQVIASVDGNHSYRSKRAADFCPDGAVSEALGLPEESFLGYGGFFRLNLRKGPEGKVISYRIWAEHGCGGARTPTGKLQSMMRMVNLRVADGYFCGHHHLKMVQGCNRDVIRGGTEYTQKMIVACSGSYLRQPEYANRANYRFDSVGVTKIQFATTRKDMHASI